MSKLTVGWERAESAAFLPPDSSVVVVPAKLTVAWRPMLGTSVLDWDVHDYDVTPGAGPDPTAPAPAPAPAPQGPFAAPELRVTPRRTAGLFRKEGLRFEVVAPGDATIRAVLTAPVARTSKAGKVHRVRRKLTRTRTAHAPARFRKRVTLRISQTGRRAIVDEARIVARLEVTVTYAGQKPIELKKQVVLARAVVKKG